MISYFYKFIYFNWLCQESRCGLRTNQEKPLENKELIK